MNIGYYLSRCENTEKRVFLWTQWESALSGKLFPCSCGKRLIVSDAFRCLYCGQWFCNDCAEEHFGKTIEEWEKIQKNEEI